MGFFEENWLWRGTQSAIFYYVSCSPWIEWKYKRKRRNEANRAQKHREEVVAAQPGRVQQPGAFQTNSDWAEEILMGPGPPKGWKRDPVVEKLANHQGKQPGEHDDCDISHTTSNTMARAARGSSSQSSAQADAVQFSHGLASISSHARRQSTGSSTSNSTLSSNLSERQNRPRPSIERRLSTAMDNIRDTLRSTMRPERWNWIRYERDDEILSGFNQRMTEMWNRATNFGQVDKREGADDDDDTTTSSEPRKRRKRAHTTDSDHFDYQKYTRNPEINELHPPVVSRLPTTRDEAAWMILPPPSAAIMAGKARPQDEPAMRWPLAMIGRAADEWKTIAQTQHAEKARTGSGQPDSIPELSDSFTESSSSDEDRWRSDSERDSVPLAESSNPAGLDLVYMKGGRVAQPRSQWHVSQRA